MTDYLHGFASLPACSGPADRGTEPPCQRWKNGVSRLRPATDDTPFERRRYSVDVIDEASARRFVTEHHYSRSYPAAVFRVGLFGANAELEGVAVFSVPMTSSCPMRSRAARPDTCIW